MYLLKHPPTSSFNVVRSAALILRVSVTLALDFSFSGNSNADLYIANQDANTQT